MYVTQSLDHSMKHVSKAIQLLKNFAAVFQTLCGTKLYQKM